MNNIKIKYTNLEDPSLTLGMTLDFWTGVGKEAAIRRHLAFLSNILANRCFFPPITPYMPVIPSVSEESYNQLL